MSKTFLEILDLKKSFEHTNGSITLFEKFNTALNAANKTDVLEYLNAVQKKSKKLIPDENINKLFQEIIYGGKKEHDVLEEYYKRISASYLNY